MYVHVQQQQNEVAELMISISLLTFPSKIEEHKN